MQRNSVGAMLSAPRLIDSRAPVNLERILCEKEYAIWVNISPRTAQRQRVDGTGAPFVKIGPRRIGYRIGDVIEWIRGRTVRSTSEATVAEQGAKTSGAPR